MVIAQYTYNIRISLRDGQVMEGKKWITSPLEIAEEISKSLASKALIAEVSGTLWDMARPLERDCELKIFTFEDNKGRDTFWYSSAHILGQALEAKYGCKLCIGPCTTKEEGFYYDAYYGSLGLNDEHLKKIESEAEKAVKAKQCFERIEVSMEQALEIFSDNKFKASSAYWRGNKDRESLQRVYGISYPDKKLLQAYIKQQEEAKKYDHRLLGKSQELIFCHPYSPGSWFFTPNGARIYKKLMQFMENEYLERGYQEVITPNIFKMDLFEKSKHAGHYKQNMFLLEIEKEEYGLKPMNCPGHCEEFRHRPRSYRELPLRMAEFGDDAHIFCRESQLKDELKGVLDFIKYTYDIFGLSFDVELSTRPESYHGERATWDKAEAILTEALNEFGKPWQINEGDGAFYGPKIDFGVCNALKKKFQCATIQLDF
ncbi:putative threonine--tRNA ligase [Rosa chinensis]|uniref:threonine--tRNA ligase n=1 Tax=Rosa chinensis TaxID=74649 RepID=A0A2P6Q726_ROSCH|nr:putative threonine--tRNA ligase [Rosa chinensis]